MVTVTPTSNQARRILDHAIDRLMANADAIVAAHEQCGVPLEDVICAVVRKALAARVADSHQMRLWKQEGA